MHSFEHYDRETGISVYSAPAVKSDQLFPYFDPLRSLSEAAQEDWHNAARREEMIGDALASARRHLIA